MHDLLSILDFIIFKHLFCFCGCLIYLESQSAKKDRKSIQPDLGFIIISRIGGRIGWIRFDFWRSHNEAASGWGFSKISSVPFLTNLWIYACTFIVVYQYICSNWVLYGEWNSSILIELGVRSLANASRARQFNPLNPPGVGWVPLPQTNMAAVRGRSCVVVRAWSVMRGSARSVVRGRAVLPASRPALPWHERTKEGTNEQHLITP